MSLPYLLQSGELLVFTRLDPTKTDKEGKMLSVEKQMQELPKQNTATLAFRIKEIAMPQ